ncbi:MAG: DNA mismatch repair protein MutS [Aridibacter sp.]
MKNATPIRRQYLEIKAKHKDSILLFRLGDFYEAFDEDAKIISRELNISLTSKPMGKNLRVPLAGIPHYVLEKHLATLISRGHRVAICEQTSDSPIKNKDGGKLIKREVTRIVTAGTVIEPQLLDSKTNNYLVSFISDGKTAGIAYADISTGDFAATQIPNAEALNEISRISPSEILLCENDQLENLELPQFVTKLKKKSFEFDHARKTIFKHFNTKKLTPFGLDKSPLAVSAAGALISYLNQIQAVNSEQITRLTSYDNREFMILDNKTFRSLEVFESESGKSLLSIIDQTQTAMGGRLLRRWLRQPSVDVAEIFRRQEHLGWFLANKKEREKLREILEQVEDLERLSSRAKANYITAFEVRRFGESLKLIPKIKTILRNDNVRFGQTLAHLPECKDLADFIESGISDELPSQYTEQIGIIRKGFSKELDKLREKLQEGKKYLSALEKREREKTGIKSLRVGFNKVFGYYIEITKPNLHLVPGDYTRKQTLIPAERFVTLELKEHESMVIHAQERILELENNLFRQICTEIGRKRQEILLSAKTIAYLDTICSLAEVASANNYTRPAVNDTSLLRIKNGRHAVVETILAEQNINFAANDTALNGNNAPQIALITGPNASGKSTYLRQTATIILLAQIGSFVPADESVIGICDRIFTRIGLYDRIGSGESTFMTEMLETAEILHHATPRSLILLDELGRGTSTYDGLAVARAVLEFIHNHPKLKSRTLFATHYHELAELEELLPNVENLHFEINEEGDKINFTYKLNKGSALKSYGVYAAKIAGLPKPVIKRAFELLKKYESEAENSISGQNKPDQMNEFEKMVFELDTDSLSPIEALMKLYELKELVNKSSQTIDNKVFLRKVGS